jgi:hypothetical protein
MPKEQGIPPKLSTPRPCILEPSASRAEPRVFTKYKSTLPEFYFILFLIIFFCCDVHPGVSWEKVGREKK